ncbi:P-loop containing nucleoside triphosphate hydrolase protein [Dichotomocladium elegans]|nr:P-loop containing nucleoside triphosphate hydrolase protein [Dichotomocladium elegans]
MISSGIAGVAIFLAVLTGLVTYLAKTSTKGAHIELADDEAGKLLAEHTPTSLIFDNIQYTFKDRHILKGVTGIVRPGEVMAIMGPSGSGKTTLLDILANRTKTGQVTGQVYVNGQSLASSHYRRLTGYVDQETTMIPTLTVYETILYSALLRLPRSMSRAAKEFRVLDVLHELGINSIKDSKIGQVDERSISGGERRRVAIACEFVTSPSILFLDEPTSGLDAYNAYSVVESLVTLARDFNRTIILTIHQPRSNIVTLFDQLIVLAKGQTVYSGSQSGVQTHFKTLGYPCPPGFNIADYLIDLTMEMEESAVTGGMPLEDVEEEERENGALDVVQPSTSPGPIEDEDGIVNTSAQWVPVVNARQNRRRLERMMKKRQHILHPDVAVGTSQDAHLSRLVQGYNHSRVAGFVRNDIARVLNEVGAEQGQVSTVKPISIHERPGWLSQFAILADRTLKNLYRNPMLMFAHYAIAVALALICGGLFYQVSNTIAGFQNRMGLFFFYEALLGFLCLTSLQVFSNERILFLRERANGYYSPGIYFLSKVLFDIIPLRVVPPLMMGLISYYMVGLVEGWAEFFKFLLVLVLFNLTAAALCLAAGVVFKDLSMANLICCMVMLFSMLFAGLLLNKDSMPPSFGWLKHLSFFNYALEALLVNEMLFLQLVEERFGLNIDVPGATILSTFGFNARNYWPDVIKLGVMFSIFLLFSLLWLIFFVKERR